MGKLSIDFDIKNGAIQNNRQLISGAFKQLKDGRYTITLEPAKRSRTLRQNNYIHSLFADLTFGLNQLGNQFTTEEVKNLCKAKFSTIDVVDVEGVVIGQRLKGTAEMETWELNLFFEQIIVWAADMFHIKLAYPQEKLMLDLDK